jgi:hypothetical protein
MHRPPCICWANLTPFSLQSCCADFTSWHADHIGQWSFDCYLVTNPLAVWSRAFKQAGQLSGVAIGGKVIFMLPCFFVCIIRNGIYRGA